MRLKIKESSWQKSLKECFKLRKRIISIDCSHHLHLHLTLLFDEDRVKGNATSSTISHPLNHTHSPRAFHLKHQLSTLNQDSLSLRSEFADVKEENSPAICCSSSLDVSPTPASLCESRLVHWQRWGCQVLLKMVLKFGIFDIFHHGLDSVKHLPTCSCWIASVWLLDCW